eukprot:GHUV01008806.1.p1 GENE.GHUV01008806.1~~GHUV01008806.1.p1  ORF type:complete len:382 (+),score=130.32 GHUV01008806.1:582-1727(+)
MAPVTCSLHSIDQLLRTATKLPRCYPAVGAMQGEECNLGANCPHSHNAFESWLHPQKYRTLLCKDGHKCDKYVCFFAHGVEQLRAPSNPHPAQPSPAELPTNKTAPAGFDIVHGTFSSSSSSPTYTTSSSVSDGSGLTHPLGSSNSSSSMHTVALLMEQVQQARKMAQESCEAAAQAERQLQVVTAAVLDQASRGQALGLGLISGPQFLPAFTAVHGSDGNFHPQCTSSVAGQPVFGQNQFGQFSVPAVSTVAALAPQMPWVGVGAQATGNYLSGSGGEVLSAPGLAAAVTAGGASPGLYGSSPVSAMSLAGTYDLADGAVDSAGTPHSQSAPLCVMLPQKQLQQQPMLLRSAASGGLMHQGLGIDFLQNGACSSSAAYYC